MTKKAKSEDKQSEKLSIPTMSFDPKAKKILEHLVSSGGSTNRKAIQDLVRVRGGALNHIIRSMKLYNLMQKPAGSMKFTFTPMSEGFMQADEEGKTRIYAKAILSIPIFKRFVMDKNFTSKPSFKILRRIFTSEYKIPSSQASKLANIFIKNLEFLKIDFTYLKNLSPESRDLTSFITESRTTNESYTAFSDSFVAKGFALELLYAVSQPRDLTEIVSDIIEHRHEFSPEKQMLIDALEKARNNRERLQIIAETIAENLAEKKATKKGFSERQKELKKKHQLSDSETPDDSSQDGTEG